MMAPCFLLIMVAFAEETCDLRLRGIFGEERTDAAIARYDEWIGFKSLQTNSTGRRQLVAVNRRKTGKRKGPHRPMPWIEIREGSFLRQTPILSSVPLVELCPTLTEIGERHEAKKFCGVEALQAPGCTVISIGCNGQWQFETQVLADTTCRVETFDCTGDWTVPSELAGRVRLHKLCLGPKDEQKDRRKFATWSSAMRLIKATKIAWLKIDCEGCEHTVLPAMLNSANQVPLPEQVSVEVHLGTADLTVRPPRQLRESFGMGVSLFQQLYALGGYFLISRLDLRAAYPLAAGCSELVFARAACAQRPLPVKPGLALYDPSRDWLDAGSSPCLREKTGHAPWACHPWSDVRAPRCEQRGPEWASCPPGALGKKGA